MGKIFNQTNFLVIYLVVVQLAYNEARQITPQSKITSNRSSEKVNEEKPLSKQIENPKINGTDVSREASKALTARDTTYSYFYVGRWTWHIPLWFTLWFSFYVTFNVFRAILGHQVSHGVWDSENSFHLILSSVRSTPTITLEESERSAARQLFLTASSTD